MKKSYKIILLCIMSVILSSINSYAELGSTSWVFPAAYKGSLTEMGATADFDTKFYLLNPNSQNCKIKFKFYHDRTEKEVSSEITLLPNKPLIISAKNDIPEISSIDKRFAAKIISTNNTPVPFIAYKVTNWDTTNASDANQNKKGAFAAKGAAAGEPALTWYFPSCQTNSYENKNGCVGYRATQQPIKYKTKYLFWFKQHTVQPSESDAIPLQIKHLGSNGLIDDTVITITTSTTGKAIRKANLNEPLTTNVQDKKRFSTIITNLAGIDMVVEKVKYWKVPDMFYIDTEEPYEPISSTVGVNEYVQLGEGISMLGYTQAQTQWYLPGTASDLLDNPVYLTVMNPNDQTVTTTISMDESYGTILMKKCSGGYKWGWNLPPSVTETITISPTSLIKINLARVFTLEGGTQYCAEDDNYGTFSPMGYSKYVMRITSTAPVVPEYDLYINTAAVESFDRNMNFDDLTSTNWYADLNDYCSAIQWDDALGFKAIPSAHKRWYVPFKAGRNRVNTTGNHKYGEGNETFFWVYNPSTVTDATVRMYLLNENKERVPFQDYYGSGDYVYELIAPAKSYLGIDLLNHFETKTITSTIYYKTPNSWHSNEVGRNGLLVYTGVAKGYAVFESVGTNETPIVVVSAWDADTNTYLSQDADTECTLDDKAPDLHPDDKYIGNPTTDYDNPMIPTQVVKKEADICKNTSRNFNRGDVFEGFGFDPSTHTDPCEFDAMVDKPIMHAEPSLLTVAPVTGDYALGSIVVSDITVFDTLMCQSSQSLQPDPMTGTYVAKVYYVNGEGANGIADWLYINGSKVSGKVKTTIDTPDISGAPVPGSSSDFIFNFYNFGTLAPGYYHAYVTIKGKKASGDIKKSNSPIYVEIYFHVYPESSPGC